MCTDDRFPPLHPSPERSLPEADTHCDVATLPIGVLHPGSNITALDNSGFRTVGDLDDASVARIASIPGVGPGHAVRLLRNRDALIAASEPGAGVDWDAFCHAADFPLIPGSQRPESGETFLASLPAFLHEVARHLADPVGEAILRQRISRSPGQQKTLQEIASNASRPLTRERVRQKQKKLLRQLSGGLLNDCYSGLRMHFRPEFSRWWRLAADRLSHLEEVDYAEFVETLCVAWNVSDGALLTHLPLILAIVTGEPQMPGTFREACRLDPRLLTDLCSVQAGLPLTRLRLGRLAARLDDQGATTIGGLVAVLSSGTNRWSGTAAGSAATEHLNLIAKCLLPDGRVDWPAYKAANGLNDVPAGGVASAEEFSDGLPEAIRSLLSACRVTRRSLEIYHLRTSRSVEERMTLHGVAARLHTHQPTIKREETIFLSFLNSILVERDFSMLPVWIDEAWLGYWGEARSVFLSHDSTYAAFAENLGWMWRLSAQQISVAAPTIWAVMTGYPDKRRRRRSAHLHVAPEQVSSKPVGRIRLRGFRRIH